MDDFDEDEYGARPTYPPIDESETDLCRALWMAVALQALTDAVGKSSTSGGQFAKASALRWLNATGDFAEDFETVCNNAGLDPKRLRRRFNELLKEQRSVYLRTIRKELAPNRGRESREKFLKRARRNELIRSARPAKASIKKGRKGHE